MLPFQKSSRNSLCLALSDKIHLVMIFVVALQKHFVYDLSLKVRQNRRDTVPLS